MHILSLAHVHLFVFCFHFVLVRHLFCYQLHEAIESLPFVKAFVGRVLPQSGSALSFSLQKNSHWLHVYIKTHC